MEMIRHRLPRNKGNGWAIQKFHEMIHLGSDITRFGSPANYDAGGGERGLQTWAKTPSDTALKSRDGFLEQVTSRLHETCTMFKAQRAMKFDSRINSLGSFKDGHNMRTNET